jgi:amino acid transporter
MSYDGSALKASLASKSHARALSQGDAPLSQSLLPNRVVNDGNTKGVFDFSVPFRCGGIGLLVLNPADNPGNMLSKSAYSLIKSVNSSKAEDSSARLTESESETNRTMTLWQLVMFSYLAAAGGPYGSEPTVANGGPLLALLGYVIVPWLFCFPVSMVTAELATVMPENGGIVRYIDRVMPKGAAFVTGYVTLIAGCITCSANAIILIQYLATVAPASAVGEPASYATLAAALVFVVALNVLGISSIGPFSKWLAAFIVIPFVAMFFWSLRYASDTGHLLAAVSPVISGEVSAAATKDAMKRFLSSIVFMTLGFFLPGACAGSVQNVSVVFPRAMLFTVMLVVINYTIPIMAGVLVSQYNDGLYGCGPYPNAMVEGIPSAYQWSAAACSPGFKLLSAADAAEAATKCNACTGGKWTYWTTGYLSVVSFLVGGKPLQWFVVLVAVFGQLGTLLSAVCCNANSLKLLADLNMLPAWMGQLNSRYNTPVVAISVIMILTSAFTFFFDWFQANGGGAAFDNLSFAASLLTLLVNSVMMVAFLMLRYKDPSLVRPFRIPLAGILPLFLFCAPTFAIAVFFVTVSEPRELIFLLVILFSGLVIWYLPLLVRSFRHKKLFESSHPATKTLEVLGP